MSASRQWLAVENRSHACSPSSRRFIVIGLANAHDRALEPVSHLSNPPCPPAPRAAHHDATPKIVEVFVSQRGTIESLRYQVKHAVIDARPIAVIDETSLHPRREPDARAVPSTMLLGDLLCGRANQRHQDRLRRAPARAAPAAPGAHDRPSNLASSPYSPPMSAGN